MKQNTVETVSNRTIVMEVCDALTDALKTHMTQITFTKLKMSVCNECL